MAADSGNELIPIEVARVLKFRDSAAVVLRGPQKHFMIFVGLNEADAIQRVIDGIRSQRPLTHDVITYVFTGFDIEVRKVVISSIVNNVFCATLALARDAGEETKTEVRLDIRASDSLVIALKTKSPIWVTRRVFEAVEDVTDTLREIDEKFDTPDVAEPEDDSDPEEEADL